MERLRIGVIDRSPSIRETTAIVLHEHDVSRFAPEDFLRLDRPFAGDLLIVERGCLSAEELARLAPDVPVVWLEGAEPDQSQPNSGVLPRPFRPQQLRQWVRSFANSLQRQQVELATVFPWFPPPLLPLAAAPAVRAALRTQLPILIYGEHGTGKLRLARALHAASGNPVHLRISAANCDARLAEKLNQYPPKTHITLCVTALEQLAPGGEEVLMELLKQRRERQARLWFLACTAASPDILAETQERFADLLHYAAVFTLRLPALRERTEDLRAIISAEGARIAAMLRMSPPTFTPEAWERLVHYLWFGNLPELEAVLARTMSLVRERPIPAHAILFASPEQSHPLQPPDESPRIAPTGEKEQAGSPSTTQQLEVLLHELAHELKNPLVTIKTISQHLERLLADETGREQVAQLAGEAVDRMDRILDNLLRFARYGTPVLQKTSVNAVLAPALAELAAVLSEKQIVLHYLPAAEGVWIQGDPAQLTFALENLLRAVARDVEEGSTLSIEPIVGQGGIEIRFPRPQGAVVERLRRFVHEEASVSSPLEPLGFLIARSLLMRNQATLREHTEETMCTLTISFTVASGTENTYAETPRFNRG